MVWPYGILQVVYSRAKRRTGFFGFPLGSEGAAEDQISIADIYIRA